MRITRIESQKKRPQRKNIYADGKFLAGVSNQILLQMGLRVGDEISESRIQLLHQAENLLGAKNAALKFLSVRARTVREVRDRLREKEFSDAEIEQAIEELSRAGLLNDAEFARMYVRDSLSVRPVGKLRLKRNMLLLGLDKVIIEEALEDQDIEAKQEGIAYETARKFMEKSLAVRTKEDPPKTRQRLAAYLARRGFPWSVIDPVLRRVLSHPEEPEE
jgi:regulatory protein